MTEKKLVRGLLDVVVADAKGEAWILAPDTGPGLGLGASKEAARLVSLGKILDLALAMPKPTPRSVGQPEKHPKFTNDAKRAFVLYVTAIKIRSEKKMSGDEKIEISLMHLIEIAKASFPTDGIFDKPKATNKKYESVKRGREVLGIDKWWRGPKLESLFIEK